MNRKEKNHNLSCSYYQWMLWMHNRIRPSADLECIIRDRSAQPHSYLETLVLSLWCLDGFPSLNPQCPVAKRTSLGRTLQTLKALHAIAILSWQFPAVTRSSVDRTVDWCLLTYPGIHTFISSWVCVIAIQDCGFILVSTPVKLSCSGLFNQITCEPRPILMVYAVHLHMATFIWSRGGNIIIILTLPMA